MSIFHWLHINYQSPNKEGMMNQKAKPVMKLVSFIMVGLLLVVYNSTDGLAAENLAAKTKTPTPTRTPTNTPTITLTSTPLPTFTLPPTQLPTQTLIPGITSVTTRLSISASGVQPTWNSYAPSISADGRFIAFDCKGCTWWIGGSGGIIVYDMNTGIRTNVAVNSSGVVANQISEQPEISADGRYVVFASPANNLVANDTNNAIDIFVHDRQTSQTRRVSVATGGVQINNPTSGIVPATSSISGNGRYVVFDSKATNVVSDDTNNFSDIFLHDIQSNTTIRISNGIGGAQGNGNSIDPVISRDGNFIAFTSEASNLVNGDTNSSPDVFLYNVISGAISRVSVSTNGSQGLNQSSSSSISGDGRYITFDSWSDFNLPNLSGSGVYLRDTLTNTTSLISNSYNGSSSTGNASIPSISADGRYISYYSSMSNLIQNDTNNGIDVFVYDRQTNTTNRVSVITGGGQASADSIYDYPPDISDDGQSVVFSSNATDLVSGDTNGYRDVFINRNIYNPTPTSTPTATSTPTGTPNPSWYTGNDRQGAYGVKANISAPDLPPFLEDVLYSGQSNWVSIPNVSGRWMQAGWRYYRNWGGATPYIEWIAQNPPPGHNGYYMMMYETDLQNWGTFETYTVTWYADTIWCGQYTNYPPLCSDIGVSAPRYVFAHSEVHSSSLNELDTIFMDVNFMDSMGNWNLFDEARWRIQSPYNVDQWFLYEFRNYGP